MDLNELDTAQHEARRRLIRPAWRPVPDPTPDYLLEHPPLGVVEDDKVTPIE